MTSWNRSVFVVSLMIVLLISGCGGGADTPFVVGGAGGGLIVGSSPTNASLNGLYNTLSVAYQTRSTTEANPVFNQDFSYNTGSGFSLSNPTLFNNQFARLQSYDFAEDNAGMGSMLVETMVGNANSQINVPIYTDKDGDLAILALPSSTSTNVTTPIFNVQMRAIGSGSGPLTTGEFAGKWGFISLSTSGNAVAAELTFSTTSGAMGHVSGVGFQSETTKAVSAGLLPAVTTTYQLNPNRDKLIYLNSEWFVHKNRKILMTGQGKGQVADRVAIMMKPFSALGLGPSQNLIQGTYNLVQWTAFSANTSSAASSVRVTHINLSQVVRAGTMTFQNDTVQMTNFLGVNPPVNQTLPYQHASDPVSGQALSMWTIPKLSENFSGKVNFAFFFSEDKRYLFGVDYDNDSDALATLVVGIKAP